MNWLIKLGPNTVISLASAVEIVVTRLEYMRQHPHVNPEQLVAEALGYTKHVQRWVRDNEPPPPRRTIERDTSGRPGLMSDG